MSKISKAFLGLCLVLFSTWLPAQTTSFTQFWNELTFTRPIKDKWTGEVTYSQTSSSAPDKGNPFSEYIQFSMQGLVHYFASPRWKVTAFFGYHHNLDVPEIGQQKVPELRFGPQAIYYIKKKRYTLTTRTRVEIRLIKKPEKKYDDAYRFRQQLKIVYPFNSKLIRKGVVYGIASDEVFVKIPGEVTGDQVFDRNKVTIGAGYAITDDIQVELMYTNEFFPRPDTNELNHAIELNFAFNNLFQNLKQKIKKPSQNTGTDE